MTIAEHLCWDFRRRKRASTPGVQHSWCVIAASPRSGALTRTKSPSRSAPEEQYLLLTTYPLVVDRAAGAWGRRGHTHLDLAAADDATARNVIIMAWRRRAPPRLAKSFQ